MTEAEGLTCDDPAPLLECLGRLARRFGNPFLPVGLDPSYLTSTVLSLAEG